MSFFTMALCLHRHVSAFHTGPVDVQPPLLFDFTCLLSTRKTCLLPLISAGPEPQLYSVNYSPGDGAVGCPEEYDEVRRHTRGLAALSGCVCGPLIEPSVPTGAHSSIVWRSQAELAVHSLSPHCNSVSGLQSYHYHSLNVPS